VGVLLLALDTCDSRGSIALVDGHHTLGEIPHLEGEEYSSWLLPAVDKLLNEHSVSHSDLAGYAPASGPGSFTGVRVGLTTAKAWSEIYGKPIYPISRLVLLAEAAPALAEHAAVFIDAQRSQIFAALYRRSANGWQTIIQDSVISPHDFFSSCLETARNSSIAWVSLDPQILSASSFWQSQQQGSAPIVTVHPPFAAALGKLAVRNLNAVDALSLDANYVRRSDAEIFGKKAAHP
jgi:tRNA threonylcarbamoyladenosine biosynthesis protein TsaB